MPAAITGIMLTEQQTLESPLSSVRARDWQPHAAALKHLFLVGDLKKPVPHPFLRRKDLEMIWCEYEAGDDGQPHWHTIVDEFELVLSGRVGCRLLPEDRIEWFGPGDLVSVPHGTCVQRLISEPTKTITIKVPSGMDKVHCATCQRLCAHRQEPQDSS